MATAATTHPKMAFDQQALYTCMSCLVGFHSPLDQRSHYRSDLHRYNMKRQVAGLPPVRDDVFQQKVLQRDTPPQGPQAIRPLPERPRCKRCAKAFASDNALASHLNSRKHKEVVTHRLASLQSEQPDDKSAASLTSTYPLAFRLSAAPASPDILSQPSEATGTNSVDLSSNGAADNIRNRYDNEFKAAKSSSLTQQLLVASTNGLLAADASDVEVEAAIVARFASSVRLDPSKQCIFCRHSKAVSLEDSLEHMRAQHGFFVPERTYLIDLPGLVQYLADKVTVGQLCLYCNGRGRNFHSAEAAQKHMLDKSHCKVAYESEEDQLELSDFYDFTSSYPEYQATDSDWTGRAEDGDGEDWEDVEEGSGETEIDARQNTVTHDNNGLRYGDSELELILPSGARLGHRSLARYYRQTLFTTPASVGAGGGGALARRLIDLGRVEGRNSALVVKGRNGGEVKARNRGEAREAKRHIGEFRDSQKRQHFITRVGFVHNSQKHFRDPLLQ